MRDSGSMEAESNGPEEKIFVSIRVRPLNEKERARHDVSEWECFGNTVKHKNTPIERSSLIDAYTFDRVFHEGCSTEQVYKEGIKDVALSVVRGINSSIFAYGQTSSGKTYTMTGITEYAVRDIYSYIEMHEDREFVLKFSAMEIYNEAVIDLLGEDTSPLRLLDDREKGTVVDKLTEESLEDLSHLQELLSICAAERTNEETSMNETSSRSHQILRLTVESYPRNYAATHSFGALVASVNFVDLAGSERASQTLSAGTRLREGGHINRSLLTLGTVIRKLSKGGSGHVPYRDSKLTRILHNSIGGNARTAIICTICPARSHVEQSRNTLLFASCAKQVTTNAHVNVVMSNKVLVNQLQQELARLENELRSIAPKLVLLQEREHQIQQMDKQIKELTRQRDILQSHVDNLLLSVRKDGFSRVDKDSGSESSGVVNNNVHSDKVPRIGSMSENADKPRLSVSFSDELPEISEDNFLLDGNTPMFAGPDPCQGWEEIANKACAESEDNRKEVGCIKMEVVKRDEQIDIDAPEESEGISTIEDAESSLMKGDNEVSAENNQDALQQKIQDLQRTIERLISLSGKCQCSSESHLPRSRSLRFARSRSCKPILSATSSPQFDRLDKENISGPQLHEIPQFHKLEQKAATPLQVYKLELEDTSCPQFDKLAATPSRLDCLEFGYPSPSQFDKLDQEMVASRSKDYTLSPVDLQDELSHLKSLAKKRRSSRKYSETTYEMDPFDEAESVMGSDTEDTASVLNFVVKMNERAKPTLLKKDFDDLVIHAKASGTGARANRTKGEISDSAYLDVELRRLSFLKDTFSGGTTFMEAGSPSLTPIAEGQNLTPLAESPNLTPDSRLKALYRERKMLSKQLHKKFSRKEREELYQKWRIDLKTNYRSMQLAWRLWTDTQDIIHARESAMLVAKLVGLVGSDESPKKTFGFGFGFFGRRKSHKSHAQKDTLSILLSKPEKGASPLLH
ncbi:hypothetical protein L6164_015298 [Bauhinia variegata]|uniref:Uncharacterized protein n=1 Tax=Bauhinia variegata TaxID=167791 RepID=A0ACB9NK97_BAUVA|nr:hypothetical protein L6164_015298 [Bauhinia variegata]